MDETTSRTRSTSRRMASAKGAATTRRSSSGRSSKKSGEPAVSPARWAGVALVIAAIVGAIVLAVVSPSDQSEPALPGTEVAEAEASEQPSPSASPTELDVAVPVVAPEIVLPKDGKPTAEFEIAVTVEVPDDRTVPKKHLDLHIYNGTQVAKTEEKPKPGTTVKVEGVRLSPGANTLTAVLGSPAGPGPASEPVVVILDEDKPKLKIVSPRNRTETYEDSVNVEFTSELGAEVLVVNEANGHDYDLVIGPSGDASTIVRLKRNKNRISATSVDEAGQERVVHVNVIRLDGRPTIKLKYPESIRPPEQVRIVAEVTDANKDPMPDAEVHFTLTAPNQSTLDTNGTTNAKGRAVWEVLVERSSSPAEALELGVRVISPSGDPKTARGQIDLK